jgi:hypothetical protein
LVSYLPKVGGYVASLSPPQAKLGGGYIGITLSVRPSVLVLIIKP